VDRFHREPFLATTREEISASNGLFLDMSQELKRSSDQYMTYSTIEKFDPMIKKGLNRVALVGTPCQIKSLRKMQVLNLIPSDVIKFCFGLFCSGNYTLGPDEQQHLADVAGISWADVRQFTIKDKLIITLNSGKKKSVPLQVIESMKRYACQYCSDYSAEFADISFGGIGARDGWTTVITRTPLGRAILADSRSFKAIEQVDVADDPEYASRALQAVRKASSEKKKQARYKERDLQGKPVQIKV
jgi:coenzyme F420 hydrogenase subunit beta